MRLDAVNNNKRQFQIINSVIKKTTVLFNGVWLFFPDFRMLKPQTGFKISEDSPEIVFLFHFARQGKKRKNNRLLHLMLEGS